MKARFFIIFVLFLVFSASVPTIWAQQNLAGFWRAENNFEDGRGAANVRVILTDVNGNLRTVRTNSFGYYRFEEVAVGQTYIISVSHKKYAFSPHSRILNLSDEVFDLDFTAVE